MSSLRVDGSLDLRHWDNEEGLLLSPFVAGESQSANRRSITSNISTSTSRTAASSTYHAPLSWNKVPSHYDIASDGSSKWRDSNGSSVSASTFPSSRRSSSLSSPSIYTPAYTQSTSKSGSLRSAEDYSISPEFGLTPSVLPQSRIEKPKYRRAVKFLEQTSYTPETHDFVRIKTTVDPFSLDRVLPCEFHYLGCHESFGDLEGWNRHCKSHLGRFLPTYLACPFHFCSWTSRESSGAWPQRFDHICESHGLTGDVNINIRPNAHLISHLWKHGLINTAQRACLQQYGRLPKETELHEPESEPRDRRRKIRPHHVHDDEPNQAKSTPKGLKLRKRPGISCLRDVVREHAKPEAISRLGLPSDGSIVESARVLEVPSEENLLRPHSADEILSALDTEIKSGSVTGVLRVLDSSFELIANTEAWQWLTELVELGDSYDDIARLLVEQHHETPWISFQSWQPDHYLPHSTFHIKGCVHSKVVSSPGRLLDAARPSLDAHTLRKSVASLCGLAGFLPNGDPDWEGVAQITNDQCASITYGNAGAGHTNLHLGLVRITKALKGLCAAIALLQRQDGCCNSFSIIQTGFAPDTLAEMNTVDVNAIMRLQELLEEGFDEPTVLHRCQHRALELLPKADNGFAYYDHRITTVESCLHACALATQYLCLGFVTYCQAHLGSLSLFFAEQEIKTVSLLGIRGSTYEGLGLRMESQRLTCLDAMLRSPVMVFRWDHTDSSSHQAVDLRASAIALIDTWGTGSFTRCSDDPPGTIRSTNMRGGSIYRPSSRQHLHWSDQNEASDVAIYFDPRVKERIGARIELNLKCRLDEQTNLNDFQEQLLPLGTSGPSWRQKERQAGVQGGQYVNLTFNVTWVKDPGISLKENLLDRLHYGLDMLYFLESPCGLKVSFCSGLAQRVKMRALIADLMPAFIERRISQAAQWEDMESRYGILAALSSEDLHSTLREMAVSDPSYSELFNDLVLEIATSLKRTGLDPARNTFSVAFIPSRAAEPMRCMNFNADGTHFWTQALRDTDTCATFACFTMSCLQIGGWGCRHTQKREHSPKQIYMLQTDVHRQISGNETVSTTAAWTLRDGEVYHMGSRTCDAKSILFAKVVRPRETADPQLLMKRSTMPLKFLERFLQRQANQKYLQETLSFTGRSLRAFITSMEYWDVSLG